MTTPTAEDPRRFPHFRAHPVSYLRVEMEDSFWAPRQRTTQDVSVDWVTASLDDAGGLEQLRRRPDDYAAETKKGEMESIKFIEAMANVIGLSPDPDIKRLIDAWAAPLIEGQSSDGYLPEDFPLGQNRPPRRWQMPEGWLSHEDYAIGHYIEAAIAYREATGQEELFESAVRAADNMADELLGGTQTYVPGHPEIEQALMRLYAVTGEARYVELCGWLLGRRGHSAGRPTCGSFFQDHLPLEEQHTLAGHAVSAAYLFNGATQYVGATGHPGYREAALAAWDDLVSKKMFIHGGSGNLSAKNEGYRSDAYKIAPDDCFGEPCAAVANFNWAHSLFALTGEVRYIDVAERILYNVFAAALSLSGDSSFYTSVLQTGLPGFATGAILLSDKPRESVRFSGLAASCCPPNIVKLINTVGGFLYSTDGEGIFVKHYATSRAEIAFGPGVTVTQRTRYPWDGEIVLQISPAEPATFALRLRIPGWAKDFRATVNDEAAPLGAHDGWLEIRRHWQPGDRVELSLAMEVERVTMPEEFEGYENRAALRRGPIVYCLEEQDLDLGSSLDLDDYLPNPAPQSPISSVYIPADEQFDLASHPDFPGGVTVLKGDLRQVGLHMDEPERTLGATFIPYCVWGNRSASPMRVWLGAQSAPPQVFLSQQQLWCKFPFGNLQQ